jgi:hypothetical protein
MLEDNYMATKRQICKDQYLAKQDPQKYCADWCIATGNCDVFYDSYKFTPMQVLELCKECVLSEAEEPCDLPSAFFQDIDNDDDGSSETMINPEVSRLPN